MTMSTEALETAVQQVSNLVDGVNDDRVARENVQRALEEIMTLFKVTKNDFPSIF